MKKLLLIALLGTLLLPALPGGAQPPMPPVPGPSARPSPGTSAGPSPGTSGRPSPSPAPGASPALTYAGRGLTSGLSLTIAEQGLQTGVTQTGVANAPTAECVGIACATAAGAAPPVGQNAVAVSPGTPGPARVQPVNLGEDAGPGAEQLLTVGVGAATAMTSGTPSATGTADGLSLDLTLTQTILGQLPDDATDPLEDALSQISDALSPVADDDSAGTVASLTGVLDGLVGDLTSSPLLQIQGGQSTSTTDFETGTVSATAAAAGAVIVVLPTPISTPLVPEGLAIIEVSPSSASATADGTNRATTEADASIARITLLPGLLDGVPGLDPDQLDELPLDDILELLSDEITELLPIEDLLGGLPGGDADPPDGAAGTPLDDALGGLIQADENTGGFVIDLDTSPDQTCILAGTPVETCITVRGTSETFTADGRGVGVLAAGVDLSLLRGLDGAGGIPGLDMVPGLDMIPGLAMLSGAGTFAQVQTGTGLVEANVGRSEAGVAAAFVRASTSPPSPSVRPTSTPTTPPRVLPQTGSSSVALPALALMALSGVALVSLRRRRDV